MLEMQINPLLCTIKINIEMVLNGQMYNIPGVGFEMIVSN